MIELIPISTKIGIQDILNVISKKDDDLVFVSGSLIEGIGNRKSDLDIFVVTRHFEDVGRNSDVVYNRDDIKFSFKRAHGIGYDIEYWPQHIIEDLFKQLSQVDFEDLNVRTRNQIKIPGYETVELMSFIHRFIVGKPILNEEVYGNLYRSIHKTNYFRVMTRIYINDVDNQYDDIVGNLDQGEGEVAYLIAQDALIRTIAAYLFSKNESLDRNKWAYLKLKRLAMKDQEALEVLKECENVLFNSSFNSIDKTTKQTLFLINRIINKIGDTGGM